jgi:hypothetical protein
VGIAVPETIERAFRVTRPFSVLLCGILSATAASCKPDIQSDSPTNYQIAASLDPSAGFLEASADISLSAPSPGTETARFYLHRQLAVEEVRGPLVSNFQFDPAAPATTPWIREAGTLHVSFSRPLLEGEEIALHIEYSGTITEWPTWSANVITEDWVELGLYLPWFPYNFDEYGPFTFDVSLALDSAYQVRGYGPTEQAADGWHFERALPTNDIVAVASKDLETTRIDGDGSSVRLHHSGLDDSVTASVATDAMSVLSSYSAWFGAADEVDVTLIASKRELGGGYARPGLIVLTSVAELNAPERRADFLRFLGHEIGHLWWTSAPSNSWEDWLNESFAEYSALLLLREELGENEFQTRMALKRAAIDGTTPILGFDRSNTSTEQQRSEVEAILYSKGPLLLHELAERIGQPAFLDWCRSLVSNNNATTDAALALLRDQEGTETSEWFEEILKQR